MGNFEVDLTSYLFYKYISVVSTIDNWFSLPYMYGGWFADGWLGQGCWYLWLTSVSFSTWGWSDYFVFCTSTAVAGFGIHREYEDGTRSSDLIRKYRVRKSPTKTENKNKDTKQNDRSLSLFTL